MTLAQKIIFTIWLLAAVLPWIVVFEDLDALGSVIIYEFVIGIMSYVLFKYIWKKS